MESEVTEIRCGEHCGILRLNLTLVEARNVGEEIPDFVACPTCECEDAFDVVYQSTDGWRGYYDTESTGRCGCWEKLPEECSWMSGDWSDAPAGHSSTEVRTRVERLANNGADILVIFAPSSNAFSVGVDVYRRRREVTRGFRVLQGGEAA